MEGVLLASRCDCTLYGAEGNLSPNLLLYQTTSEDIQTSMHLLFSKAFMGPCTVETTSCCGPGKERPPFNLAEEWGYGPTREAQSQGFNTAPFAPERSGLKDWVTSRTALAWPVNIPRSTAKVRLKDVLV
ncbi:hypothetical protein SAMN00790413_05078 [Deinococcus hopiensis KR-140]|uniref:Uncharacterized protein n=1 Tax=Deinococcus hopiensis KR-140 TaxID=695939 RepID=A0A1W1UT74_9DEIO|nr:hypothetical protein SAMN00790413_05078 [Deinococcus hopiensis KR-140]